MFNASSYAFALAERFGRSMVSPAEDVVRCCGERASVQGSCEGFVDLPRHHACRRRQARSSLNWRSCTTPVGTFYSHFVHRFIVTQPWPALRLLALLRNAKRLETNRTQFDFVKFATETMAMPSIPTNCFEVCCSVRNTEAPGWDLQQLQVPCKAVEH